jgi:hypothetical protein
MAEKSWERYLWKHNLAALDPLSEHPRSLQLLDIVAKNGTEGFLSLHPTLVKVGSMCDLRTDNNVHPDWAGRRQKIRGDLDLLEGVMSMSTDLFDKRIQLENYECTSTSGCGILASIVTLCKAGANADFYRRISVDEIVVESVKGGFLAEVLEGGRAKWAVWEPDVATIRRDSRYVPLLAPDFVALNALTWATRLRGV